VQGHAEPIGFRSHGHLLAVRELGMMPDLYNKQFAFTRKFFCVLDRSTF